MVKFTGMFHPELDGQAARLYGPRQYRERRQRVIVEPCKLVHKNKSQISNVFTKY